MGLDYTRSGMLFFKEVASSGHTSAGAVLGHLVSSPEASIVLHELQIHVKSSGAQGASNVQLQSLNGSTTYAVLTIGTATSNATTLTGPATSHGATVTNTILVCKIADSIAKVPANSVLKIVQNTTDVSVAYDVRVFGSPPSFS